MKNIFTVTLLTMCCFVAFSQDFSKDYQRLNEANEKLITAVIPAILNFTFCPEVENENTAESFQNTFGFKKQLLKWLKTSNDIINELSTEAEKCHNEIGRLVDSYSSAETTAAKVYECDRKEMAIYEKYAGANGTIRLLLGKWNNHIKNTLLPQAAQLAKTDMRHAAQIQQFVNFAYSNEVSSQLQFINPIKNVAII